jgi:monoamine oxidase
MAKLPPAPVDCVIVGAGAAGIAAARRLREKGRRVVILEARARVGGRAWTDITSWGLPFDRGASWIEHFTANPLRHEIKRIGVNTIETSTANVWLFENGTKMMPEQMSLLGIAEERVQAGIRKAAKSGIDKAFSDVIEKDDLWARLVIDLTSSATIGTTPKQVSAIDLALRKGQGEHLPTGGMGSLFDALSDGLDIRLSKVVSRINATGKACRVTSSGGELECRTVLVTLPTDLIASGDVKILPKLPPVMEEAFASLALGTFEKVAFKLNSSLYTGHDFVIGHTIASQGLPHAIHVDSRFPTATVLYGAEWADTIRAGGDAAKIAFGEAALQDVFGNNIIKLIESKPIVTDWRGDPFSRGSYAVARPGQVMAREVYRTNIADRVFFAGEADFTGLPGSVGGAWLSGVRAAEEIIART